RLDDVVVAGAAAEVALEPHADLLLRRVGVALEQLLGRHDHAGRAEPALEAMLVPEGLLQGMERRSLGEALDGRDLGPVRLHREHRAGLHAVAVELDGARPAIAGVATHVRPGEPREIADVVHQQQSRLDLVLVLGAIDGDRNPAPHTHLPLTSRSACQGRYSTRIGECLGWSPRLTLTASEGLEKMASRGSDRFNQSWRNGPCAD